MRPGWELDAVVAEKVMGLQQVGLRNSYFDAYDGKVRFMPEYSSPFQYPDERLAYSAEPEYENEARPWREVPRFSTSIADAWTVVEHLDHLWFEVAREAIGSNDMGTLYQAITYTKLNQNDRVYAQSFESMPHAICLAALRAVGVEVPE